MLLEDLAPEVLIKLDRSTMESGDNDLLATFTLLSAERLDEVYQLMTPAR